MAKRDSSSLKTFNELYYKYCDAVYSNISKLIRDQGDAEDILQDVFITLWENQNKLYDQSIAGWLFVVSHNKAMDHLKRNLRLSLNYVEGYTELPDTSSDSVEKEDKYLEQMRMISEAVEALPLRKKEVFQLCRLEGKSKEDVAMLMGISVNSVADYLKQSNGAIREYVRRNFSGAIAARLAFILMYALNS